MLQRPGRALKSNTLGTSRVEWISRHGVNR
jgi:hypothetical protein